MGFPFRQFFTALTGLAPVVLMLVPGGAALAPFVPLIVKAIAEAEKRPGASGMEKRAYVQSIVANAAAITNQAHPGTIDELVIVEASGHYVDAVIGTLKSIEKATVAQPDLPVLALDTTKIL